MLSVRRATPPPTEDGRGVGLGRFEEVPGTPEDSALTDPSSLRWEVVITDLLGSNVSSLCSPLVWSQSKSTLARNFSAPRRGTSTDSILVSVSCYNLVLKSRRSSEGSDPSPGFFGRRSRLPCMSRTDTPSGERLSTALATNWVIAAAFCAVSFAAGLNLTITLAFAGWRASVNTESFGNVI